MKKLEGKVAVITGASKGIGEGISRVFAKYGAKLVLAARSESVLAFAKELNDKGYEAIGVQTDVSDESSASRLAQAAIDQYGTIDILVNNAGVCLLGDFLTCSNDDLDYHLDINIKGVWNMTKAVAPYMVEKEAGKIVIMSSVTGDMVADPGEVAYATSKAALVGFTKAMARELADYNITVNAICPGYVRTPMVEKMAAQSCAENPESVIDGMASAIPLKRLAQPEEVGELAAFLSSDESSYITGTQIVIDGGSTLPETSTIGI